MIRNKFIAMATLAEIEEIDRLEFEIGLQRKKRAQIEAAVISHTPGHTDDKIHKMRLISKLLRTGARIDLSAVADLLDDIAECIMN